MDGLRFLDHGNNVVADFLDLNQRNRRTEPGVKEDILSWNFDCFRLFQKRLEYAGCFSLCQLTLLTAITPGINVNGRFLQTVFTVGRGKQAMTERKE